MAIPAREQVVQAIVAALESITALGSLHVERERLGEMTEEECPRILLYELGQTATGDFTGERGWTLVIEVQGWVTGEGHDGASALADAISDRAVLRAEVERILFADVTLGGKVRDVRLPDEPPPEQLDLVAGPATLGFASAYAIEYATPEADPYTLL